MMDYNLFPVLVPIENILIKFKRLCSELNYDVFA